MSDKLLIVDDSAFSRRMIHRAIPEQWNVDIAEADGGCNALAMCKVSSFGYVFLDLTMPDMDGIEVLRHLKEMSYPAKVYVISADIQQEVQKEARELGAVAFIPKPVTAEELDTFLRQEGVY
ncbi:response regulator [Photobacterium sp. SDRW27]|uniref:response regulator n=1 Tax=Photobacterium obscurum TaxID=2829490 RepID=UPI0022431580|nr:response regulator [Photobacterium obscurum]MCW8331889.1 response regulator [Photobacterium obscurum]